MTTMQEVQDFVAQRSIAVVGASRKGGKFGNIAYKELRKKGYQVMAMHPDAETLEGDPCYRDLSSLPQPADGVLIVVPPASAVEVVRTAAEAGIKRVWLQQGAESDAAITAGREHGLSVVHGHCILMFSEPVGLPHSLHRWIWKVLGKLPS